VHAARLAERRDHRAAVLAWDPGLEERPAERGVRRHTSERGRAPVHERDVVIGLERDDEDVGEIDEIAIASLELLALALELHLSQRLLDDRDQLLGTKRFEDEGEGAGAERTDRGVDAREAGEEKHLGERRD